MKHLMLALTTVLSMALLVSSSGAQGPVIYPAKGQSSEQQLKDKGECHVWAVQQSGFDPAKTQPSASPPAAPPPTGERARGPAAKKQEQAQQQAQKQQQAQTQQQQQATAQAQSNYSKAVAACLEGRGYTVK
jgi:hypothetical protein